jgi:hypothetical protein
VRGDGRLKQHQSNKHIYNFSCSSISLPCTLLLVLRRSSRLEAANPRGSRGGQADLGQPIAATHAEVVPPGRAGFWVSKALVGLSCVPSFWRASLSACCRASRSASRVHGDVFVCEHAFGDSAGDEVSNGLQPVLAKGVSSEGCDLQRYHESSISSCRCKLLLC